MIISWVEWIEEGEEKESRQNWLERPRMVEIEIYNNFFLSLSLSHHPYYSSRGLLENNLDCSCRWKWKEEKGNGKVDIFSL